MKFVRDFWKDLIRQSSKKTLEKFKHLKKSWKNHWKNPGIYFRKNRSNNFWKTFRTFSRNPWSNSLKSFLKDFYNQSSCNFRGEKPWKNFWIQSLLKLMEKSLEYWKKLWRNICRILGGIANGTPGRISKLIS